MLALGLFPRAGKIFTHTELQTVILIRTWQYGALEIMIIPVVKPDLKKQFLNLQWLRKRIGVSGIKFPETESQIIR